MSISPPPGRMHLRQRGFDVVASLAVNMRDVDDDEHLAYAAGDQRALLTFNVQDFAPLHDLYLAEGKEHWGIIFSTEEPFRVLFRRLLRLLYSLSAQDLKKQVRWLNEFK